MIENGKQDCLVFDEKIKELPSKRLLIMGSDRLVEIRTTESINILHFYPLKSHSYFVFTNKHNH